jgi:hypothetical protein
MTKRIVFFLSAALATLPSSPASAQDDESGDRLGAAIDRAVEADGPWLLPTERSLIERKCGHLPGTREDDSVSFSNGVLVCANGRRVDDPETRAMVAAVGPRISRRVERMMSSPAIRNAIDAVSSDAVRRALSALGEDRPRRRRR